MLLFVVIVSSFEFSDICTSCFFYFITMERIPFYIRSISFVVFCIYLMISLYLYLYGTEINNMEWGPSYFPHSHSLKIKVNTWLAVQYILLIATLRLLNVRRWFAKFLSTILVPNDRYFLAKIWFWLTTGSDWFFQEQIRVRI